MVVDAASQRPGTGYPPNDVGQLPPSHTKFLEEARSLTSLLVWHTTLRPMQVCALKFLFFLDNVERMMLLVSRTGGGEDSCYPNGWDNAMGDSTHPSPPPGADRRPDVEVLERDGQVWFRERSQPRRVRVHIVGLPIEARRLPPPNPRGHDADHLRLRVILRPYRPR